MLAEERRAKIISAINADKSVMVQDLSVVFNVTEETIRRDLKKLEDQGILVRTYGGAVLAEESGAEMALKIREGINIAGKDLIGRIAADMVNDGEIIILDASTSALHVAKHIKKKKALTVITNAVKVAFELAECDDINVISTGGILRHKSLSYVGRAAEKALDNYYANKVFFSCKGMTLNRGLTDSNEQEVDIKRAMIKCSESAILLCDHMKFGRVGFVNTVKFADINCMISDTQIPNGWETEIRSKGVKVVTVTQHQNKKEGIS